MTRKDRIYQILQEKFGPEHLEVHDDSHQHIGHQGARPEGETHYRIEIRTHQLADKSRVARERAITQSLKSEFDTGLHALQVKFVA